ncbi:MAG: alpha/beta hydrolase [Burkholderiaceae bacterium]|jgi:arylformamidase
MEPLWNPRKAVPDSEVIIARFSELSGWVRSNVSCKIDQPYGAQPRQSFDIFLPRGRLAGLHIFIHGGFWMSRDKSVFSFLAASYIDKQWALAIPNFPLMPSTRLTEMIGSVKKACKAIWDEYGASSGLMPWTISGHSSGAHLVTRAILGDAESAIPRPASITLLSGAYDLTAVQESEVNKVLELSNEEVTKECALQQSCYFLPAKVRLYVGGREPLCWIEQSNRLAKHLQDSGYSSLEPLSLAGHDHFSILEPLAQPQSEPGRNLLNLS